MKLVGLRMPQNITRTYIGSCHGMGIRCRDFIVNDLRFDIIDADDLDEVLLGNLFKEDW